MFGVSWCSTVSLLYPSKLDPIPIFCFQLWFYPWYNSNLWNVWSSRVHQLTWNLFWINWVSIVSFSRAQTHTCACAQTYTHTFSFFHFPFMGEWVGHILKDLFERFLFICCIGFSWIICFSKLKSLSINISFLGVADYSMSAGTFIVGDESGRFLHRGSRRRRSNSLGVALVFVRDRNKPHGIAICFTQYSQHAHSTWFTFKRKVI